MKKFLMILLMIGMFPVYSARYLRNEYVFESYQEAMLYCTRLIDVVNVTGNCIGTLAPALFKEDGCVCELTVSYEYDMIRFSIRILD